MSSTPGPIPSIGPRNRIDAIHSPQVQPIPREDPPANSVGISPERRSQRHRPLNAVFAPPSPISTTFTRTTPVPNARVEATQTFRPPIASPKSADRAVRGRKTLSCVSFQSSGAGFSVRGILGMGSARGEGGRKHDEDWFYSEQERLCASAMGPRQSTTHLCGKVY
ncbi:hypothetical protein FA13DRAFT_1317137 [Coprinellus micaceus]|uniref:Uncharacterized protein n=1 Tax=Coprinellus micaceus TaxID=71717 RepID=A0A4Y7SR92_COPMI|nr:hypothetical protein FA13DRAFT_1317137 [Coprinellus micaceus]